MVKKGSGKTGYQIVDSSFVPKINLPFNRLIVGEFWTDMSDLTIRAS